MYRSANIYVSEYTGRWTAIDTISSVKFSPSYPSLGSVAMIRKLNFSIIYRSASLIQMAITQTGVCVMIWICLLELTDSCHPRRFPHGSHRRDILWDWWFLQAVFPAIWADASSCKWLQASTCFEDECQWNHDDCCVVSLEPLPWLQEFLSWLCLPTDERLLSNSFVLQSVRWDTRSCICRTLRLYEGQDRLRKWAILCRQHDYQGLSKSTHQSTSNLW